jgi:hypothetical protein
MIADKFQWVFAESLLNACAKDVRLGQRQRLITPFRLGLALTTTCASQHGETSADCHGAFNAFWGTPIIYKAFYSHVAKPHLADFARTLAARLIRAMTLKGRGWEQGRAFREFRHSVRHAGRSFAMHESWREVFPGRFKAVKPAAVALHTTVALLCEAPTPVGLTPDTANAQAFLPEPASLRAAVLWADRGYIA